jgi:glycosyltransferase involved in cell wall biosynthesis
MKNSVGSYPTKMFEYMAIGLPQVTSNFVLYQNIVEGEGSGICVNPADPAGIAAAILEIIQNPAKGETMRLNGLKAAEKYLWSAEMEKVYTLYGRLLS